MQGCVIVEIYKKTSRSHSDLESMGSFHVCISIAMEKCSDILYEVCYLSVKYDWGISVHPRLMINYTDFFPE